MLKIESELKDVKDTVLIEIANELIKRGKEDQLIQETHNKANKSLEGMYSYIRSEMKKRAVEGAAAAPREEIFGMAQHYYDEDSVGVPKKNNTVKKKQKNDFFSKLPKESLDDFDL